MIIIDFAKYYYNEMRLLPIMRFYKTLDRCNFRLLIFILRFLDACPIHIRCGNTDPYILMIHDKNCTVQYVKGARVEGNACTSCFAREF